MKIENKRLIIRQLDNKISLLASIKQVAPPAHGWIHTTRTALNMSLRQLGNRMSITPQSVRDLERREREGTLSIKTLKDAANALDMQLVYALIPNNGSVEKMIADKAYEMAARIVKRASITMKLEDQANSEATINEAINDLADEIRRELPKKLWD